MPLPLPPARMGSGEARKMGQGTMSLAGPGQSPGKNHPWIAEIISFWVKQQAG